MTCQRGRTEPGRARPRRAEPSRAVPTRAHPRRGAGGARPAANGAGRGPGRQVERRRLHVRGWRRLRSRPAAPRAQRLRPPPGPGAGGGSARSPAAAGQPRTAPQWLSLISAASCASPPSRSGGPRSTSTSAGIWTPARCGRWWGSWETAPSAKSTRWVRAGEGGEAPAAPRGWRCLLPRAGGPLAAAGSPLAEQTGQRGVKPMWDPGPAPRIPHAGTAGGKGSESSGGAGGQRLAWGRRKARDNLSFSFLFPLFPLYRLFSERCFCKATRCSLPSLSVQ